MSAERKKNPLTASARGNQVRGHKKRSGDKRSGDKTKIKEEWEESER
jgi:hypothetical protein